MSAPSSQWKPGIVAMATVPNGSAHRVVRGRGDWICLARGVEGDTCAVDHVRPLAVIDPEDGKQVERLLSLFADALNWGPHNTQRETYREPLRLALRVFADSQSPRPEEPTGRYAVVEDSEGLEWVRAELVGVTQWKCLTLDRWADYADISVDRVLSEGEL